MNLTCPICGTPTDSKSSADFPFCSERCRLLDLGNWSAEKYKISEPVFDEDLDETPPGAEAPSHTAVRTRAESDPDD